jgi:hypothetical protein
VIIAAFFFVPTIEKNEEIEEDWISLIPFSVLIISILFVFMYRQQYQGISHPKILVSLIIVIISATVLLLIRGLYIKTFIRYPVIAIPGFLITMIISFLTGALFVFTLAMLSKMLGGILQMPLQDIFHFINFLALVIFISLIISFILIVKKVSAIG